MNSNVLPAYVPHRTFVPFRNEKNSETSAGSGEYVVSVAGVTVHAFAIPACIVGAILSMMELNRSYCCATVGVIMSSLFLACILQIALSVFSLVKGFFTSSKTKFIRHALTSVIPVLFASTVAIVIANATRCREGGIIAGPILFLLFYVPYYFYLTEEKSFLRPYVKAD